MPMPSAAITISTGNSKRWLSSRFSQPSPKSTATAEKP